LLSFFSAKTACFVYIYSFSLPVDTYKESAASQTSLHVREAMMDIRKIRSFLCSGRKKTKKNTLRQICSFNCWLVSIWKVLWKLPIPNYIK
jgi:hypothetical protein